MHAADRAPSSPHRCTGSAELATPSPGVHHEPARCPPRSAGVPAPESVHRASLTPNAASVSGWNDPRDQRTPAAASGGSTPRHEKAGLWAGGWDGCAHRRLRSRRSPRAARAYRVLRSRSHGEPPGVSTPSPLSSQSSAGPPERLEAARCASRLHRAGQLSHHGSRGRHEARRRGHHLGPTVPHRGGSGPGARQDVSRCGAPPLQLVLLPRSSRPSGTGVSGAATRGCCQPVPAGPSTAIGSVRAARTLPLGAQPRRTVGGGPVLPRLTPTSPRACGSPP